MSRSHKGKVKLDVTKLERRDEKLAKRLKKLQQEIFMNRELITALKESLIVEVPAPAVKALEIKAGV